MVVDKYIFIAYVLVLPLIFLALYSWLGIMWSSIIYFPIVLILSFPAAYYFLKKYDFIDQAKNMASEESRLIMGLEILRGINPKKAKKMEREVKQYLKEKANDTSKNDT